MTAGTAKKLPRGCRYLRSCATSSARWRSESPPIVFEGEILHWLRIRLVLTRPYLGTAISMSMTFAVWTYSGGSISSVWILTLLPFRSRFSCARFERMSFALRRASILWSSDLSGAALEDWTGACIGAAVYPRPPGSETPFGGFGKKLPSNRRSVLARRPTPRRFGFRRPDRESSPCRPQRASLRPRSSRRRRGRSPRL